MVVVMKPISLKRRTRVEIQVVTMKKRRQKETLMKVRSLQTWGATRLTSQQTKIFRNLT